MSTDAYPLSWPAHWPRTPRNQRIRANFSKQVRRPFDVIRDELLSELRLLGADRDTIVISSNFKLRLDGIPYAKQPIPEDVGVAVYFELEGKSKAFPCDKWDRVEDNLRAISLTIGAMRGLERWGSKHMADATFVGYDALPATSASTSDPWWDVLGVRPSADKTVIRAAYHALVKQHHPDVGGDPSTFARIQGAWEEANSGSASTVHALG